jgi:imidazolonepropionase-like amidohydrolase
MSGHAPFGLVASEHFDGTSFHPEPVTFRIENGIVTDRAAGDQGAALAAQGLKVDRVPFLMPGLVEAHSHLFLHGAELDGKIRAAHQKAPVEDLMGAARDHARATLGAGITLVRDAGDKFGVNHAMRALAVDPASGYPLIRSPGLGVKRPNRYGAFMARDIATDDAIEPTIADIARTADDIKVILTGIIDFGKGAVTDEPQFDEAAAARIAQAARAAGKRSFAHCSGAKGLKVACEAGFDSIEHGFFMNRESLERMAERGIAWVPTFSPVHFQWARPEVVGWPPETVSHLGRILERHTRMVGEAARLGVALVAGSDAGSQGVPHGQALIDELFHFLAAGVGLAAVLASATSVPRRLWGAAPAGPVKGWAFDAVALAQSPVADAGALRKPLAVWREGVSG